jgi:hypothetical protein
MTTPERPHPLTVLIRQERDQLHRIAEVMPDETDAIERMAAYLTGLEKAARLCGIPTK